MEKILRLQSLNNEVRNDVSQIMKNTYLDTYEIKNKDLRYIKIEKDHLYSLLKKPNIEYIMTLKQEDIKLIHSLKKIIHKKLTISLDEFNTLLYVISKENNNTKTKNLERQKFFFQNIYQLLFGKNSGPRLAPFLWSVEEMEIIKLLDV